MSSTGSIAAHPVVAGIRGAACDLGPDLPGLVWQLSDDEVEDALTGSFDVAARLAALQGALLREAATRDLKARTKALDVPRWLGDRFRLSRHDAAARVKAAAALGRHPLVGEALAAGAVAPGQSEVLTQVLDTIAVMAGVKDEDQEAAARFLVAQCATLKPLELRRAGTALIEALTVTPSEDDPADEAALQRERARAEAEAQQAERNHLTVITGRGGKRTRWIFEPGTIAAAIAARWLHDKADPRHPGSDGFDDTRPQAERRGDALADLLTRAAGTPTPRTNNDHHDEPDTNEADVDEPDDDEPDDDEPDDDERDPSAGQQPLPGIGGGSGTSGSSGTADGQVCGTCGSPTRAPAPLKAVVAVTTTLDGLRSGLAKQGLLDTGLALSSAALRMLACDAQILPAVLRGDSEVLDLGRAQRDFNRAQRRAAWIRDRGCVAPGCDQPPSACHLHHMWWWTDGGPTDLDNAALLCDFHHRMVHRQGWAMTLAANGYPQLTPPASIDPQQRPRQHHRFLIPDHGQPRDPSATPGRQRS